MVPATINGVDDLILIDKPAGITSFGVVARIRRVLSKQAGKKVKVGHCGTLDPFATGLLLLCTGKECKNAGTYMKHDKWYDATIRLGKTSTTGDLEGDITLVNNRQPTRDEINRVLQQFTGDIQQRPPVFSALKVNGVRAYKLARDGKEIELPLRTVTIYQLDVVDYSYPTLKIRVHVSSGTYIRSLAVDIGEALGTGAYCTALRRTKIGKWDVAQAKSLIDFGITD